MDMIIILAIMNHLRKVARMALIPSTWNLLDFFWSLSLLQMQRGWTLVRQYLQRMRSTFRKSKSTCLFSFMQPTFGFEGTFRKNFILAVLTYGFNLFIFFCSISTNFALLNYNQQTANILSNILSNTSPLRIDFSIWWKMLELMFLPSFCLLLRSGLSGDSQAASQETEDSSGAFALGFLVFSLVLVGSSHLTTTSGAGTLGAGGSKLAFQQFSGGGGGGQRQREWQQEVEAQRSAMYWEKPFWKGSITVNIIIWSFFIQSHVGLISVL